VRVEHIDRQVLDVLYSLHVPTDWRNRLVQALADDLRDKTIEERIAEIKQVIENMDYRFDYGLVLDKTEYLTKRMELQKELERLQPAIKTDLYQAAADLIDNFRTHFEECQGDVTDQNRLIGRIVERVFVEGKRVAAIMFKAECHMVLHYGGEIARYYIGGELSEIDRLQDTGLIQTQAELENETQAAIEGDNLYIELKAAYPEATEEEIQNMLISGDFVGST
jgi:hypothetical protein